MFRHSRDIQAVEEQEIKRAITEALSQVASEAGCVVIYKPTIQINYASGGGATVEVRNK